MLKVIQEALTFDDVLLVPNHSNILPSDASLKTQLTSKIQLNIPLLSAAMDTVTESELAIAIAQEGGIGIVHKNLSPDEQANEVVKVKKYESGVITDPVVTSPDCSIKDVIELTSRHKISGVPVVEGKNLVGIVTSRDLRFVSKVNPKVSTIMTPKDRLVTVQEGCI
jgi:IMP dehydrogenase